MEFTGKTANPLAMFMRQPKIHIRLPSNGRFWPESSLELTETGEYPVYSMTAKDELSLKVPDALMNGQAVVDVIQSCIPNIKNAWHTPSIDLDYLLIAIRIATYGELMTVPVTAGKDLDLEYQIDLRLVMDQLSNQITWDDVIPLNSDITVFVKPINYKLMSEAANQTFETQKLMMVVNDDKVDEDTKVRVFKEGFAKLSKATLGVVSNSISRIDTVNGSTSNPDHIFEFVSNCEKSIFTTIDEHLKKLQTANAIKPLVVSVTDEMRESGVTGETIEVPLTFDPSTFFG
jgi:hypothetical protein